MKRFKPVRNRVNKKLKRKQTHHKSSENALSLVGYSVKESTVIGGTIIKRPAMNTRTMKEEGTVLNTYKETGLYSMIETEGNQPN